MRSSATSRTARSRARREPPSTRRLPTGSRRWPANASPTTPTCSRTTRPRRSRSRERPGTASDPELERRAARYLVLAGDRAFELDVSAADGLLPRALELLPEGSEEHGLALLKIGEAAQVGARFEDAREHCRARRCRARSGRRDRGARRVAYGLLGNVYFQLGSAERMRDGARSRARAARAASARAGARRHLRADGCTRDR